MGCGIRNDLIVRLVAAHESKMCFVPGSRTEYHRLNEALRRGDVVSPAPKIYALPSLWDGLSPIKKEQYKVRALARLHSDWIFAGPSAAVLQGLYVSYRLLGKTHVVTSRRAHTRSTARLQRHPINCPAPDEVDGVMVTPLVRTAFDCMNGADFRAALCIADSALRAIDDKSNTLVERFAAIRSRSKDKERVLATASLANALSESGGESTARAVMIEEGFMIPTLQKELTNPVDTSQVFRVDFFWHLPGGDVAGELDGREKYRNPAMTGGRDLVDILADERLRESRVSGASAKVMRFSYSDVLDTRRFRHLLTSYGIPSGFEVPWVARK